MKSRLICLVHSSLPPLRDFTSFLTLPLPLYPSFTISFLKEPRCTASPLPAHIPTPAPVSRVTRWREWPRQLCKHLLRVKCFLRIFCGHGRCVMSGTDSPCGTRSINCSCRGFRTTRGRRPSIKTHFYSNLYANYILSLSASRYILGRRAYISNSLAFHLDSANPAEQTFLTHALTVLPSLANSLRLYFFLVPPPSLRSLEPMPRPSPEHSLPHPSGAPPSC